MNPSTAPTAPSAKVSAKVDVEVAIVGGGSAGLSAALALGRARRSVLVIDAGTPRNAPAAQAHNLFTRDGTPPRELLRIGREQLQPYGTRFLDDRVVRVSGDKGSFRLELAGAPPLTAARLLLATGVQDKLPGTPGLRELWGKSVFTCPYCHGWEVRDAPLAVLGDGALGYDYARFIRNWSLDVVLLAGAAPTLEAAQLSDLRALGVQVVAADVLEFESLGGELSALRLSDGRRLARRAVFMHPPQSLRGDLAQQLGCALSEDGLRVVVDETGQTSVPGVYAAGDMVSPMHALVMAAASGTKAAAMLNRDFVLTG